MTTLGSQRLLQIAIEKHPKILEQALRRSGALIRRESVDWRSPLPNDSYKEYRDGAALKKLGIAGRITRPLADFWPARGPVWDALGVTRGGRPLLVEAKAHIPEFVSGGTRASAASKAKIEMALAQTRQHLARRNRTDWTGQFYQYANRLAFQYFLRDLNGVDSGIVFLHFLNAVDVDGPTSVAEWQGATRLIHACRGLPEDLRDFGVFDAFVDVRRLTDAA